jgi:integrase
MRRRGRPASAGRATAGSGRGTTKGAAPTDLQALDAGCAGNRPLDLCERTIVVILVTTAARNSVVRLLRLDDVDAKRSRLRFWRGKGGKTLLVTLHPDARTALERYLAAPDSGPLDGRPIRQGVRSPARAGRCRRWEG